MTNKNFFKFIFDNGFNLGCGFELRSNSCLSDSYVFSVLHYGKFLPLFVEVSFSKRSIFTNVHYTDVNVIKFSPYELREWCPSIFLPYTNYLHWQKFLRLALEIYVETNPKLL